MKTSVKSNEIILPYLDRYGDTEPKTIKKSNKKSAPTITFYTDATSRSYTGIENEPGLGGYAWVREKEGEDTKQYYAWSMNNATPNEVEMQAIYSVIQSIDEPANIRIVTDSKVAQEVLSDHIRVRHLSRLTEDEIKSLDGQSREISTVIDQRDLILEAINKNRNIKGLEIEHVRSHTMDWSAGKKIWSNHDKAHDKLFRNIIGNRLADVKAQDSIAFTLRKLADIHLSTRKGMKAYGDIPTKEEFNFLLKNYHGVKVATLEYMAKKGVENFSKTKINDMFNDNGKTYKTLIEATSLLRQITYSDDKYEKIKIRNELNRCLHKKIVPNLIIDGIKISGYNSKLVEVSRSRDLELAKQAKPSDSPSLPETTWTEPENIKSKTADKFSKRFGGFSMTSMNQGYLDKINKNKEKTLES